jgi:PAS domain S-box-containing protein
MSRSSLILNVDDSEEARYAKSCTLRLAGFEVFEAATGREALTQVRELKPDLVLLNVNLPDLSGLEVCRRIKEDSTTAAILLLQTSASSVDSHDKVRGLEGGADNYLVAPVEPQELIANVSALLRLRGVERELRENEERFRQLAENIADVFWIFDPRDVRLLYVSPAYERLWGCNSHTLYADSSAWLERVHPEDRAGVRAAFNALLRFEDYEQEYRLLMPDASERWIRDRGFPIQDEMGSNYRVARISEDVTAQKKAEKALQVAAARKDEFLATLAHELRNPLAPMRTAVELMNLEAGASASSSDGEAREIIGRQIGHLVRLVDDLLDVSRITQGRLSLQCEPFELAEVIDAAVEATAAFFAARAHRLEIAMPECSIRLNGDRVRLAQALGNLLHNAGKYTPQGGHIELRVEADAEHVRLAVIDSGIGIAAGEFEHIFDMFTQVRRTDHQVSDGLGVGLSLARKLVGLHGGTVAVNSSGPDLGSCFVIELPIIAAAADLEAERLQSVDPQTDREPAPDDNTLKILLVDDSIGAVAMLSLLLRKLGHRVEIAHEGEAALRIAQRFLPHVVLLDIDLPGMDGYQVARALRQFPSLRHTQLIALTGYGHARDREAALAAGFSQHLVKPLDFRKLATLLEDIGSTIAAAPPEPKLNKAQPK